MTFDLDISRARSSLKFEGQGYRLKFTVDYLTFLLIAISACYLQQDGKRVPVKVRWCSAADE